LKSFAIQIIKFPFNWDGSLACDIAKFLGDYLQAKAFPSEVIFCRNVYQEGLFKAKLIEIAWTLIIFSQKMH